MAAAPGADPELVSLPCLAQHRIAHFHLFTAPLTADAQLGITHPSILACGPRPPGVASRIAMIPAIILAAGASSRMGRAKAVLPLAPGGDTFVARLVQTFARAGADDIVVVVGAHADQVRSALSQLATLARSVENAQYERGQLSSLLTGLDIADRPGVRAVLAMPVDMPLVAPDTVRAVIAAYRSAHRPIVRPVVGGRHGHPVLFDRSMFGALRAADLSRGARAVIAAHLSEVLDVPVDDTGAIRDIDTPEEYERCTGLRLDRP
jgi:molybdenum cofactor cytidylyltransferase